MAIFIIIIGLVIWYLVSFQKEKNRQHEKLDAYGGFHNLYSELLDEFYEMPNIKVLEKSKTAITFLVSDSYAVTHFYISHSFNKINITWDLQSITFGEHKLNWVFPDYQSQTQMIIKMMNDMENYNNRVLNR